MNILHVLLWLFLNFSTLSICIPTCNVDGLIRNEISWKKILQAEKKCAKHNLVNISKLYNDSYFQKRRFVKLVKARSKLTKNDILQTIQFINQNDHSNPIDSFFLKLCQNSYSTTHFEISGKIKPIQLFEKSVNKAYLDSLENGLIVKAEPIYKWNKDPSSLFRKIINLDSEYSLEKLVDYLDNDSATRLVIRTGVDVCDPKFYLSISDIALNLIEIITRCNFFDRSSNNFESFTDGNNHNRLFSDLYENEKKIITDKIINWQAKNKSDLTTKSILL